MTDRFDKLRQLVHPGNPNATPTGDPAPLVAGGYGVVPGAKHTVNPNVPAPVRRMTERDAQNLMQAEMLTAVRGLVEATTQLTSQIGRQGAHNGVLRVSCTTFDAGGVQEFNHPVTVGSIIVHNTSASNTMTVQLGPGAAASTPGLGQGFHIVPAGAIIPVPIGQKAFVIYGTAGDVVNVQAFTGLQGYGATL